MLEEGLLDEAKLDEALDAGASRWPVLRDATAGGSGDAAVPANGDGSAATGMAGFDHAVVVAICSATLRQSAGRQPSAAADDRAVDAHEDERRQRRQARAP